MALLVPPRLVWSAVKMLAGDKTAERYLLSSQHKDVAAQGFIIATRGWSAMQEQNIAVLKELTAGSDKILAKEPVWQAYGHVYKAAIAEAEARVDLVSKELHAAIKDQGRTLFMPYMVNYGRVLPNITMDTSFREKIIKRLLTWAPWAGEAAVADPNEAINAYLSEAKALNFLIPRPCDGGMPDRIFFAEDKLGILWDKLEDHIPLTEEEGNAMARAAEDGVPSAIAGMAVAITRVHEIFWPVAYSYFMETYRNQQLQKEMQAWAALSAGEIAGRTRKDWLDLYKTLTDANEDWIAAQAGREQAYFHYIRAQGKEALATMAKFHPRSISFGFEDVFYNEHLFYARRLKNKKAIELANQIHESQSSPQEQPSISILDDTKEAHIESNEDLVKTTVQELNKFVGLKEAKEQIKDLYSLIKQTNRRREMGYDSKLGSMHMLFLGPAGTGKTSIARLLAQLYYAMGVLPENKLVEVDRKDLVGEVIGETALKTKAVIDSALGGILFIDEAYTLAGQGNDFGKEAIATLMKEMEDNRDNLIVIMAGYDREMKQLLESNSGLPSRFPYTINFQSYSSDELARIYLDFIKAGGYKIGPGFVNAVREQTKGLLARVNARTFGNGRAMRTMYEQTLRKQARRVDQATKEQQSNPAFINTLLVQDIPKIKK